MQAIEPIPFGFFDERPQQRQAPTAIGTGTNAITDLTLGGCAIFDTPSNRSIALRMAMTDQHASTSQFDETAAEQVTVR